MAKAKKKAIPTFACIEPDKLYDHAEAARVLRMSPENFKNNWIRTGKVDFIKAGNNCWLMGYAIINAVLEYQIRWGDDELEPPSG